MPSKPIQCDSLIQDVGVLPHLCEDVGEAISNFFLLSFNEFFFYFPASGY